MNRTARSLDRVRGEPRRLSHAELDSGSLRRELVGRLRWSRPPTGSRTAGAGRWTTE